MIHAIILLFLSGFTFFSFAAAPEKEKRIAFFELDHERVYKLPVYFESGTTTIMFPAEVEAIHSANIAMNTVPQNANPAFLMAYIPGSYYFAIRALRQKAQGVINIVYAGKTYILELTENEKEALSSVTFKGGGSGGSFGSSRFGGANRVVSQHLLKSLLDKAKAWDTLKKRHPNITADVAVSDIKCVSHYDHITCTIERVWKFSRFDALVFYVKLENKTDKVLYYNPRETAFAVGEKKAFVSLVDASGEMPPNSTTLMFCVVMQTTDGLRKLSADNDWKVLLYASGQKRNNKEL